MVATRDATRYRYKPFVGSSHTWAINNILREKKDIAILDVGCAKGIVGKILSENNFPNVDAVEVDEHARKVAKEFYHFIYPSIDNVDKKYDLILLLDVLEHIENPKNFLENLLTKLSPSGKLLLSVPNVAFLLTRLQLLFGNFNYTQKGILDRTHLRFFTKKTILNLLQNIPRLRILSTKVSSVPIELFLNKNIANSCSWETISKMILSITNLFPTLLGYQHLILIQKEE